MMTMTKKQAMDAGYTTGVIWERSLQRLEMTQTYRDFVANNVDFVVVANGSGTPFEIFRKEDYPKIHHNGEYVKFRF